MSNHQSEDLPELAAMFKALSNEHRLQIFLRLLDCCPTPSPSCCDEQGFSACVGDLGRDLEIAPSTVSHHIKELRQAGLIHLERQGRFVRCWAIPEAVARLRRIIDLPAPAARCT